MKELARVAVFGLLMFGGGVAIAREMLPPTTPGLPLTGTQCLAAQCGPADYHPPIVADVKRVIPTGAIAPAGPGDDTFCPRSHKHPEDATMVRAVVVETVEAAKRSIVVVAYGCSSYGLTKQYLRIPYNAATPITLETIRARLSPQR